MLRDRCRRLAWRSIVLCAALATGAGCGAPVLSRDGKLVFQQGGARGASVITANGVEFFDGNEVPQPVVRRSVDEPWRPATGFLLPADGVWRRTSTAVPLQGPGLLVVLRSSDVLVPSWGGEILLRLDVVAPTAAFPHAAPSIRARERVAVVVDGAGQDTVALADAVFEDLGDADRAALVDAATGRTVLPSLPGSHRTLLHGAVERLLAQRGREASNLPRALTTARGFVGIDPPGDPPSIRHVVILTDDASRVGAEAQRAIGELAAAGVRVSAVATTPASGATLAERRDAVARAVPPPGDVVLEDVHLSISAVPAPAHVIELSGGESALGLYGDRVSLGEMYAGEARTEVARIALPPWVPGEPLEIVVASRYRDVASGRTETAGATLRCRYSAEVGAIAEARHGDVIAYASALAMVRRLHRAFLGSQVDRVGGLRRLAALQARSLADLGRVSGDPALGAQAEVLSGLLGVIDD